MLACDCLCLHVWVHVGLSVCRINEVRCHRCFGNSILALAQLGTRGVAGCGMILGFWVASDSLSGMWRVSGRGFLLSHA